MHKNYLIILAIAGFTCLYSCNNKNNEEKVTTVMADTLPSPSIDSSLRITDTLESKISQQNNFLDSIALLPDSAFIELARYSNSFKLDIRYATDNNFTKQALYDCANCLLRKIVADSLVAAQQELIKLGYGMLLFDCYRPISVQQKMWEIVPNPIYVADPQKGSMHNRGNAVDLSLYDLETGTPLDMGTEFDFFGREAHHAYQGLSEEVLQNRLLLKSTLEKYGFKSITSEWWHYSFNAKVFRISDEPVPCISQD
ncbi:M15 family metallopeptidase [Chondrinema litorale]|uniref:M15 family metallopeptidase n=1 Tax=Chondrinema litorale TaxID=2994555 RepID=UPI002543E533|nr:M15 family metallopeptidase [Chondrinema litorale]UZR93301.1 M15 family metallopeptidase [Chondrinema litorale]